MKKLFLAVSSMIVTGFLVKSYKKLCDKPAADEEVNRRMRAAHEAHREIERLRADARNTFNRMSAISTPRDGGLVDALLQMAPGRFM